MKKYIIIGLIIAVLLGIVVALSCILHSQIKETNRLKTNLMAEYTDNHSIQQTITPAEFKKYFADLNTKLKQYGIKAGQVQNIINIKYHFIDTLIPRDTLIYVYDTIGHDYYAEFDIRSNCTRVIGNVCDNIIEIESVENYDSILISLYREKNCLFNHRIKAIAISQCKGDTLQILRNLKVERKNR